MESTLISLFQENLAREMPNLKRRTLEVIVGLLFFNEEKSLQGVVETARKGLCDLGLSVKAAIVLAGPKRHEAVFAHTLASCSENDRGAPVRGLLLDQGLSRPFDVRVPKEWRCILMMERPAGELNRYQREYPKSDRPAAIEHAVNLFQEELHLIA
jgi:hypothetical protein